VDGVFRYRAAVDWFGCPNKNAVVRLYAFQALKQKHADVGGDLLKQFQHDETMVETLEGCIGGKKTVKELAAQNLRPALTE
jgi:hypothetical protein